MRHASGWIRAVGSAGLVLVLAACAGTTGEPAPVSTSATPTPSPTSSEPVGTRSPGPPVTGPAFGPVSVTRTGGIAGVTQTVRIGADGSWTYTEGRGGTATRGRLTEAEQAQLAGLVTSAAFAQEARLRPQPGQCADMFVYTITVGEFTGRYDECPSAGQRPTLNAVVSLLVGATAL